MNAPQSAIVATDLETKLASVVASVSGVAVSQIKTTDPLERYGINSTMIMELSEALTQDFPDVSTSLFFEHRTIAALAAHLTAQGTAPIVRPVPSVPAAVAPAAPQAVIDPVEAGDWLDDWLPDPAPQGDLAAEDIAIVAMSGRYPQAPDLADFWQNLCEGRDSVTEVPADRWDMRDWFDPNPEREDRVYAKWGGFLDGIDRFDARFFNVSPREAKRMDPQERLFLQEAWKCLEGAGYAKSDLAGSRTGVFVGAMWSLYQLYGAELTAAGTPDAASSSFASIANRLSWFLDLRGPSLTVDSMCSSALTALNLAIQALRAGTCDQALVGAVNLCAHPAKYLHLTRGSFAAKDGKCRAFGAGGSGYVPGEGVGVVLVKPLSKAVSDGDTVLAVIKACEINHGGNTYGYTVPNPTGQNAAIAAALAASGAQPAQVRYVEAHGTGTALGDPIEVEGLLRSYGQRPDPLRIGSVKTNIGHLEAAAGMAGLHKLILQIQNRQLVPSLHADHPNPNIDWSRLNVQVQRKLEPLVLTDGDVMALSAFGAGGSNAHLVLAPALDAPRLGTNAPLSVALPFLFSAATPALLTRHLEQMRDWLKGEGAGVDLVALAATLALHRDALAARCAFVALDRAELLEWIQAFLDGHGDRLGDGHGAAGAALPAKVSAWVAGADLEAKGLFAKDAPRVSCPPRGFDEKPFWLTTPCGPNGLPGLSGPKPTPAIDLFAAKWVPLSLMSFHAAPAPDHILASPDVRALAEQLAANFGLDESAVLDLAALQRGDLDGCLRAIVVTGPAPRHDALVTDGGWLLDRAQKRVGFDCLHVAIDAAASPLAQLVRLLPAEQARLVSNAVLMSEAEATPAALTALWAQFTAGALPLCASLRQRDGRLERLDFEPAQGGQNPLNGNGWHVITGGTGGIGLRLAAHLAGQGVTRLVLTGRRALPPRETWPALIADHATAAPLRDQLARLLALPDSTRLVQWDLEDTKTLSQHIATLAQEAPIALVVHLAGVVDDPTMAFVDKTDTSVARVLGAKLGGARALIGALAQMGQARLLLVSSQSAIVPKLASGVLDYAIANAALNDLALEAGPQVQSLMLPNWTGAGFGDAATAQLAQLALPAVTDAAGLALFDGALASPAKVLFGAAANAAFDMALVQRSADRGPRQTAAPVPAVPGLQAHAGLVAKLAAAFAPVLDLDPKDWPADARFGVLGVDSVLLTRLGRKLEGIVGVPVAADVMIAHDTLDALADWIETAHPAMTGLVAPKAAFPPVAKPVVVAPAVTAADQGIAIVGIGTVLPGAETAGAYWQNLLSGRDLVTEVPADRWPVAEFYGRDGADSTPSKWGSFVQDIAHFDATEFGLPASAGEAMDPLVRLALWATRGALCDAGLPEADMRGRKAGVFLGSRVANWADRLPNFHRDSVLGTAQNFIAAHICHWLDLAGPGVVIDTACSSSLYATHLACASLRSGESDLALAGGSECLLDERPYQMLGRTGAMSPTGRCRTFDAQADGFVPGEGAVVLVLKRLQDALAQGDRIYAVIEGSAVNNDGRTMGVTTPNPERQKDVIRQAMAAAGAQAADIGYIEAHGTGTALGDPMELRGLTEVFSEGGAEALQYCGIGSVKTNIGHLLSSAGASGLAKVALSLHHQTLVPTLHCDQPNPRFAFEKTPFFPVLVPRPFVACNGLRRAGISGFGFGGTNVHIQLSDRHLGPGYDPQRSALPVPKRGGPFLWHPRPGNAPVAAIGVTVTAPHIAQHNAASLKSSPASGFQLVRT